MNEIATHEPDILPSAPVPPDPQTIDIVVGEQIKARRVALGITQSKLAEKLGLSFQQIQKYEWGANRVSSSKLFEIACFLNVAPDFFFEPLLKPNNSVQGPRDHDVSQKRFAYVASPEGTRFVETALNLPRPVRMDLLRLMQTLLKE